MLRRLARGGRNILISGSSRAHLGRNIPCRANWHSMASLAMVLALEHIRRMRGGAQSHLMRCDDGGYYVVKFQNNPQHVRVLANEMLGTKVAGFLGLRVPQTEVVEVRRELIELTADLVIQLGTGRTPSRAGRQLGSPDPRDPTKTPAPPFPPAAFPFPQETPPAFPVFPSFPQ